MALYKEEATMTTRRIVLSSMLGAAAGTLISSLSFAADDILKMPWDKVVEAAKAEGELTFYAWWGEEFWRSAAADFGAKYGIKAAVVTGDRMANIGKVVAEASSATGTID